MAGEITGNLRYLKEAPLTVMPISRDRLMRGKETHYRTGSHEVSQKPRAFDEFLDTGPVFSIFCFEECRLCRHIVDMRYAPLLLLLCILSCRVVAAPGDLDLSFGGTGKLLDAFYHGEGHSICNSIAIQGDGKIVVAGGFLIPPGPTTNLGVARYNPDGAFDAAFNGAGKVATAIGGFAFGNCIVIQGDGKLIVAGISTGFTLVRYHPDGNLDMSFNGTGKVITAIGDAYGAQGIALQSDGKIIVAGSSDDDLSRAFLTARYNADGSLDISFNDTGMVTTSFSSDNDYGKGVAIQSDGRIVVAGYSRGSGGLNDIAVVRYNADGSLDTTFNGTGKVRTDFGGSAGSDDKGHSIMIQSDGKIIVVGMTSSMNNANIALVRYNANGSLDTTFHGTGKVTADFGAMEIGYAGALQADGRIVVVGTSASELEPVHLTKQDMAVARFNTDGSADTTFGGSGLVTTAIGIDQDRAFGVAMQSDGKIVVVGDTRNSAPAPSEPTYKFAIVRYKGDPPFPGAAWRQTYFGSPDNTGSGADLSDPDNDGIPNLLEFAAGSNPLLSSPPIGELRQSGNNMDFSYSRPKAALLELAYSVEYAGSLSGTWELTTALASVVSDDGITQQVQVTTLAASPGRNFARLRVTRLR